MNSILRLTLGFALTVILQASPALAQKTGNGGAGVNRNGIRMTFGSAGLWTEALPAEGSEVPGLERLIDLISDNPLFMGATKERLLRAIVPTGSRQYHKVLRDKFDQTTQKRLIGEYSRIINKPGADIELFAVTDTRSKKTYVLPAFYSLNSIEQMAILFHEAYWIIFPEATYADVISAEVRMQKFIQNPKSASTLRPIIESLSELNDNPSKEMGPWAMKVDEIAGISNGTRLDPKTGKHDLNIELLLGQGFITCAKQRIYIYQGFDSCKPLLVENAVKLRRLYPQSEFIQYFAKKLTEGWFRDEWVQRVNGAAEVIDNTPGILGTLTLDFANGSSAGCPLIWEIPGVFGYRAYLR